MGWPRALSRSVYHYEGLWRSKVMTTYLDRRNDGLLRLARAIRRATCVVVAFSFGLLACDAPRTYRVPSRPGAPFNEETAVEASRSALIAAGYDAALLEPGCYW